MSVSAIQAFMLKLFSIIFSALLSLGAISVQSPAADAPVKPQSDEVEMSFVAWADPQVSNYLFSRYATFVSAAEDIQNEESSFDALVMAGDIAENGLAEEYKLIYDGVSGLDCKYIMASGNHDLRMRGYSQSTARIFEFANALNTDDNYDIDSLSYSKEVNGIKFIVLGSDRTEFEEAYLSDVQLAWLKAELEAEKDSGKPVFVINHQCLKDMHGLPDTWNSPIDSAGSVGDQSDELKEILSPYGNVFFITGHLHTGIGKYTYERIGEAHSINLPSLCINNKDGDYNEAGIGFFVEVYADRVLFRARNYAKGEWLPEYDINIPLV